MNEDIDIDTLLSAKAVRERERYADREFVARIERQLLSHRHVSRLLPLAAVLIAALVAVPLLSGVVLWDVESGLLRDVLLQTTAQVQTVALRLTGFGSAATQGGLTLGLAALAVVFATWTFASD